MDNRIIEVMADSSSLANRYRRREDAYAMLLELRKAGFDVVPVEPTPAMIEAGDDICPIARGTESHRAGGGKNPEDYWRVMVKAARHE